MEFTELIKQNHQLFLLLSFAISLSILMIMSRIEVRGRNRVKKLFTEDLPEAIHDEFQEKQRILGDEIFDEVFKYCEADESRNLLPSAIVSSIDKSYLITIFHTQINGIRTECQRDSTIAQVTLNLSRNPPMTVTLYNYRDLTADFKPFGSTEKEKIALLDCLERHIKGCCLPM